MSAVSTVTRTKAAIPALDIVSLFDTAKKETDRQDARPAGEAASPPRSMVAHLYGVAYTIGVWTAEEWECLARAERPDDARPMDGGGACQIRVEPMRVGSRLLRF